MKKYLTPTVIIITFGLFLLSISMYFTVKYDQVVSLVPNISTMLFEITVITVLINWLNKTHQKREQEKKDAWIVNHVVETQLTDFLGELTTFYYQTVTKTNKGNLFDMEATIEKVLDELDTHISNPLQLGISHVYSNGKMMELRPKDAISYFVIPKIQAVLDYSAILPEAILLKIGKIHSLLLNKVYWLEDPMVRRISAKHIADGESLNYVRSYFRELGNAILELKRIIDQYNSMETESPPKNKNLVEN